MLDPDRETKNMFMRKPICFSKNVVFVNTNCIKFCDTRFCDNFYDQKRIAN